MNNIMKNIHSLNECWQSYYTQYKPVSQVTFQVYPTQQRLLMKHSQPMCNTRLAAEAHLLFHFLWKPAGMSINSSGVISFTPPDVEAGGRVVVRAVNGAGTFETHFNLYVSDAVVCSADLISYHKMDDGTGTSFDDYQGGPNATSASSLPAATGRVGGAALLSPSSIGSEMLSIPDNDQYEWTIQNDFSFAIWIYPLGKPGFRLTRRWPGTFLFRKHRYGCKSHFWSDGQDNVTDVLKPKFRMLNSAGDPEIIYVSTPEVTPNTWHHMAFSYDALVALVITYESTSTEL